MITMANTNMVHIRIFKKHETYLKKLREDGPKYGPKHVAVIKYNQCKQSDLFFYCCVDGQNIREQKIIVECRIRKFGNLPGLFLVK
jgi:hypothetical protein